MPITEVSLLRSSESQADHTHEKQAHSRIVLLTLHGQGFVPVKMIGVNQPWVPSVRAVALMVCNTVIGEYLSWHFVTFPCVFPEECDAAVR